jgi:multicomponent Na+:H+ antiporter subunit C
MTITLAITVGVLYAAGTYLLLQRTLTRIVIGLALMGHGANVLLMMAAGGPGAPPLIGDAPPAQAFTDPLPQALALTAIVITFGVIAFLLALAYRSRALTGNDTVEDDIEDARTGQAELADEGEGVA